MKLIKCKVVGGEYNNAEFSVDDTAKNLASFLVEGKVEHYERVSDVLMFVGQSDRDPDMSPKPFGGIWAEFE